MTTNNSSYPLISIITLNYNQPEVTCEFLNSCKQLTYPNYEIIVCDMASYKDPRSVIEPSLSNYAKLYVSDKNLGFAGGNNWGMQFAQGDYILLLNNDTEVSPNLLEKLLIPFETDLATGIVCPLIKYFEFPNRIQYAGFSKMNTLTGRTRTIGYGEEDSGQYNRIIPTFGGHGAAMMVKKNVISEVGRLPEAFFLYYEEWDWSTRILRAGFKIYLQGETTVYHKESMTVGKRSLQKEYYLTRNRILYMRRNYGGYRFAAFSVFFLFFTFPKSIFKYLSSGNMDFLKAFLRGVIDNFTMSTRSTI